MWNLARLIALGLGLALTPATDAMAKCDGAQHFKIGEFKIARVGTQLFFRTDELALDFDGSPIAYGAKDQGQENICVGLAPNSEPCRGKDRGPCYPVCQHTFASWARTSGKVANISRTMCSIGLGGGACSVPDVRLQAPPHSDFFVSETSLKVSPEKFPTPPNWLKGQTAQLDPGVVRYIVAPTALANYGVHYGDVGIAYNVANHARVAFIVGDCCGLGEASVSLLAALRPERPPTLTRHINALGVPVMRYASGISGDFRFVIVAGTADLVPKRSRLARSSASKLPDWIERTADIATPATSTGDILACTADLTKTDR